MPFSDYEIDRITNGFICAQCYGSLMKSPTNERKWTATCRHCGRDIERFGRISVHFAERLGQKNLTRYRELRDREPRKHTEPAKIIKELGF